MCLQTFLPRTYEVWCEGNVFRVSVFLSKGGGGKKIEKCSECHGKPKKCIKIFSDYTPFDHVGGGGEAGSLVPTLSTRCATRGGGMLAIRHLAGVAQGVNLNELMKI